MLNSKTPSIFDYDFEWFQQIKKPLEKEVKNGCCEKYKKKKEKYCKNCPEKTS